MKSRWIFGSIVFLFLLGGCVRSEKEKEQTANLFIEYMFLGEKKQSFEKKFSQSKELIALSQQTRGIFQEGFIEGFLQTENQSISSLQLQELAATFFDRVKLVSTFSQVKMQQRKSVVQVWYEIYGLDMVGLMSQTLATFSQEVKQTQTILSENEKSEQLLIVFKESLQQTKRVEKPVTVKLLFVVDQKNKWKLKKDTGKQLEKLYYAFLLGKKNQVEYVKDLTQKIR
ncbi:hypothetical protein ACFFIF_08915 [Vagococcus entomophilus]|uniref:DUF5105 domain-containing protein n=1 Tax=Vagococcus entomophilus TaxID=1160095 RepID=A0A430AGW7_9ENTE|nr:hypothetical protein [Vagococcus entomophilus]RSU07123.1 hypothetical protein CBF30_07660 [Vagococcus entomophilus]